jgi:hypothetical protein
MCDTPPTLITVHVDLVQHFIEDTVLQLVTGKGKQSWCDVFSIKNKTYTTELE